MPRFFDFFRKNEKDSELEVALAGVERWLKSRADEEFKKINLEGNIILQRLKDSCSSVRSAAEEFSRAEIDAGELSEPLIPTIRNSRDGIASKVMNTASKLEFPQGKDFDDLVEAGKTVSQSLAQIDQTLKTHGRVVFRIMSKEVRPLLSNLKQMQREAARLSKLVEDNSSKAETIRRLRVDVTRLMDMNSEILSTRTTVNEALDGSEEVKAGERSIAKRLEEVRRSKEYKASLRIADEEANLSLKLRSLKAEFDTAFSKLRKPLEKYGYAEKLSREKVGLLERYIESPSTGLMEDEELVLMGFLDGVKYMVELGKISVKNSQKVLNRIEELRPTLKSRRDTLKKMADDLEDARAALKRSPIRETEDMQKRLEEKQMAKVEQATFIKKRQSDIEETLETMKKLASRIEADISETFGVKLKISGLASEEG